MEKLELKHLAPYLPYNLDIMFKGSKQKLFNRFVITGRPIKIKFKPILRPISDLHKMAFASEWDKTVYWLLSNRPQGLEYGIVEVLCKEHFDIFGLIDKGLAIDINTLKDE
jgi:hypothetical protein